VDDAARRPPPQLSVCASYLSICQLVSLSCKLPPTQAACLPAFLCSVQSHPRLRDRGGGPPPIVSVEMVQRTNLWQYQGTTSRPYLKITTALPNMVAPARGALEDGVRCSDGRQLPSLGSYESNVLYALRFMVDTSMGGGQWLEVPAGVPVGIRPGALCYCYA
jgi:DNA polymerase family B, exonuclease domain